MVVVGNGGSGDVVPCFGLAGDFAGRVEYGEAEMGACDSWHRSYIPTPPSEEEEKNREEHTRESKHHHRTRHRGLPSSEAGERVVAGEQGLGEHRTKGGPGGSSRP